MRPDIRSDNQTGQPLGQTLRACKRRTVHLSARNLRPYAAMLMIFVMAWQTLGGTAARFSAGSGSASHAAGANLSGRSENSVNIYGPRRFDRTAGPLTRVVEQFTLPPDTVAPYTIQIDNGAAGGSGRVSFARVRLNTTNVATPLNFTHSTPSLTQTITLQANNTLEVLFVGDAASFITINVKGTPATGPPPVISDFNPKSGPAGTSVKITGTALTSGTDPTGVTFNGAGNTQLPAQVTSALAGELQVIVPDGATTGPIRVTTAQGTALSLVNFEVVVTPPTIQNFNPKRGTVGTEVSLTGSALKSGTETPQVTFAGGGDIRVTALVKSSNANQVDVIVPNGAATGLIDLVTAGGRAVTSEPFTATPSQEFELTAAPSNAAALQRGTALYIVQLTSAQPSFTQLARLSVNGLPAGVKADFEPPQVTAGASSTLRLSLAEVEMSPGSYPFTITATADVDNQQLTRSVNATLNVNVAGQTTLAGRVMSSDNQPIMGATVSLDGRTATTDAAGAFLLTDVTAGNERPLMVDGRTASAPNRTYPVIIEPANIIEGQSNVVPYTFFLPPIDVQAEVQVVPGQTTVATNPRVPDLEVMIPPDAHLRNRDGSPVARISVTPLDIDRTPAPLPPDVATAVVFTNQPGGAISDVPMPVVYPNLLGNDPGTRIPLYAFNHDTVQWYIYGYGRVSDDGRTIQPEIDPATGKPYGLRDFSWFFPGASPDGNPGPDDCGNRSAHPVDLTTGIKLETMTDIYLSSPRSTLSLMRIYSGDMARTGVFARFGRGFKDNFDVRLSGEFSTNGAGRVVMPEQASGKLFSYARTDPDGALVFTTTGRVDQLRDVVRRLTNGTFEYRTGGGGVMRFDASRRLSEIVDANGNSTTLAYSGVNLTSISDATGRSITLTYDGSGRVTRATDPIGRFWQYGYQGGAGGVTSVTDPLGGVTRYNYTRSDGGADVQIHTITDARGTIYKQITYDDVGRVISEKFADGGIERYSYALSGRVITATTYTDVLGHAETTRFNANGYLIGKTDALGQTSIVKREIGSNLPTSSTGPCGCTEDTRQFDARGNVTAVTNRLGQTMRFEYEPVFNKVTKLTDNLGRVTLFTYDARGNLASTTNALNQTTTFVFDNFGQVTSVTDPLGHTRRTEYDAQGNVTASVDALGNRTTTEYDTIGRPVASVDALGHRATVTYDALDRVVTSTDYAGIVLRYEYDANGNRTKTIDALGGQWLAGYDKKDRPQTLTDPLGRIMRMVYNLDDQLIARVDPAGRTATFAYDARGKLVKATDPLNGLVSMDYDANGSMTTMSDQRGNTTSYSYDELRRVTAQRNPLGQVSSVVYDENGNIKKATDRAGRQVNVTYDLLNRPSQATHADAIINFTYDAAGRLNRLDDSQSGSVQWSFDDAGRVLSETTPSGVVSYTYNADSQRASMKAADRPLVTYGYDTAARLSTITQGQEVFTYSYDNVSRLSSLQRPNGVKTSYSYDALGRPARIKHANAANQAIEDYNYTYHPSGEIASITSLLSNPQRPGERTAAQADAANRIEQFGDAHYTFDAQGRTTAKTDAQGTTGYVWDARGRMKQSVLPGGQTVNYSYDALGRMSSRAAGGTTTSYLYDGRDVVEDKSSDGGTVDYLNGFGVDNKLRQSSSATGALYFLPDHLGSTAALTDASGGVVDVQQYDAFGASTGSALTRYGFTGRERDASTGLLYFRARWYDSQQGRFLSEDPIGAKGGLNLYGYAGNNPVNFVDPLGLSWSTFFKGLVEGGAEGLLLGLVVGALFGALEAATAGTASAIIVPILALLIGTAAAYAIMQEIITLITADMCPDERHYRIGRLIGQTIGAVAGGGIGKGIGSDFVNGAGGGGAGGGCPTCGDGTCFVAGTLVQTSSGEKPIEEIQTGDVVLSANPQRPEGGEGPQPQTVTRTFTRQATVVLDVDIGRETITVTPEHPFWVVGDGWTPATQLKPGSPLLTQKGRVVRVRSVRAREGRFTVYNFEVGEAHSYFVSTLGVLVHNQCGPTIDPATGEPIGRFIVDPNGNVMIEPQGGSTVPAGRGGVDTHTTYPNGSNYQRLNPQGHPNNPTPHGHGHLPGTGPGMRGQGPSIDPFGNTVPFKSSGAHWPIK